MPNTANTAPPAPPALSFEDWLRAGVTLGYCTEQFCQTHDRTPMHDTEEAAWEAGSDPCCHVVRPGVPSDWALDE